MIKFFAIQHIPTGHFLPEYGSRKGRGGYTKDEPQALADFPPRIFRNQTAATNALRWWLEGKAIVKFDYYEGDFIGIVSKHQPHRKAEEMRIVEIEIKWRII